MAVTILTATEISIDNIITAIEGIIDDLNYSLEDLSNIDIETWTGEPLAQLFYDRDEFLDTNGQQSNEAITGFTVQIKFREVTPILSRAKASLIIHNLHYNLTPENINDAAKLVLTVFNQIGTLIEYEASITTLNFTFDVRYRNNDG